MSAPAAAKGAGADNHRDRPVAAKIVKINTAGSTARQPRSLLFEKVKVRFPAMKRLVSAKPANALAANSSGPELNFARTLLTSEIAPGM